MKRSPEQVKKGLGRYQVKDPAAGKFEKVQQGKNERDQEKWNDNYKLVHGFNP
jgi:hypothetical protein